MKTFENITWKPHSLEGAIQGTMELDNDRTLSVVAGNGLYSTPRDSISSVSEVSAFEVAVFEPNGDFWTSEDWTDEVVGWQTREDINNIIIEASI